MLLGKGSLDGVRLLSRKTVEAMTTDYLTPEQHTHPFFAFDRYDADRSALWTNRGFGYGVAVRTRQVGLGPSVGSFSWPGAFGTTWIADPKEDLMATLLLQVGSANPFYTQVGEDFVTLPYRPVDSHNVRTIGCRILHRNGQKSLSNGLSQRLDYPQAPAADKRLPHSGLVLARRCALLPSVHLRGIRLFLACPVQALDCTAHRRGTDLNIVGDFLDSPREARAISGQRQWVSQSRLQGI
jgi:hypothetical protein